jgi:hypothetical protein
MSTIVNNGINYTIISGTNVQVGDNINYSSSLGSSSVTIPGTFFNGSTTYTVVSIVNNAFLNNTYLTNMDLSNCTSLTIISSFAFSGNANLINFFFPNSLISIYSSAFRSCRSLISLTLPTSLTIILDRAFFNCSGLTSITLPAYLNSIGPSGFQGCTLLTSVTFNGLTIPTLMNSSFSNIGSNSTAYYQKGTTNLSTLTTSGFFTNYVEVNGPIPCFKIDTKILTNKGYIPIQDLKKGDLIKTLKHDFKPIVLIGKREINHHALEDRIKDQLYKCDKNNFPEIFEPLIITGCNSILVDNFVSEIQKKKTIEVNGDIYGTDEKYRLPACVDERTTVYEIPGINTIYHLALENDDYFMNYGIYANGLLVESCSKRYLKELSGMELVE